MKKYKNIIFDIGNILYDYRWVEMIMELGVDEEEARQIGAEIFNCQEWTDKFDRGIIDENEICKILGERNPHHKDEIWWVIHNPEKMPLGRPEVWELVRQLKEKGYKLYYLSNYNHYLLDAHIKDMPWPAYMDGGILSCDVHQVKPEAQIYHSLLDTYNLDASECFFIDDRAENVEAAIREGIDAYVADSEEKIKAKLLELLDL